MRLGGLGLWALPVRCTQTGVVRDNWFCLSKSQRVSKVS